MKKINILLGLALAAGSFSSCEMDYFPTNNIEQSKSFTSAADLQKHTDGIYRSLRSSVGGDGYADMYVDLFHPTVSYGNTYGNLYGILQANSSLESEIPFQNYYLALNNINNVIQNGASVKSEDPAEQAKINKNLGEAYFMRAFAYSYLVRFYAKDYNAATASTDLGVPLKTEVNVGERLGRSTVQQTYDFILSDLAKVEELWNGLDFSNVESYKGSPAKLTPDVLTALKARVALDMDNYTEALAQARKLVDGGNYPLITDAADFQTMWMDDQGSEIIMHFAISQDELPNELSEYTGNYVPAKNQYSPLYIPQKWVIDAYEDADIRKEAYFYDPPLLLNTPFTGIYMFNKYPRTKEYNASGNYAHAPILFRISEMYLIAAEAAVKSGDTAAAAQYLNALRTARGLTALPAVTLEDVQAERLREMIGENQRLIDLKRWNLGIVRHAPQNPDAVADNALELNLPAGHDRMVWPIPAYELNTNAALKGQQNPGW